MSHFASYLQLYVLCASVKMVYRLFVSGKREEVCAACVAYDRLETGLKRELRKVSADNGDLQVATRPQENQTLFLTHCDYVSV